MALFALLSDDKLSVKRIDDFPAGTVFKPGFAFPAVIAAQPAFNVDTENLVKNVALPVAGVVNVTWTKVSKPQADLDKLALVTTQTGFFTSLEALESKLDLGTATAADRNEAIRLIAKALIRLKPVLVRDYKQQL